MTKDMGASGKPDRATAVEPVPVSPLRDGIPSAGYYGGAIDERKEVSRFLIVLAARATHRYASLPWWSFYERARVKWSMANLVMLAEQIERGDHCDEQAKWLSDIDGGEVIRRGVEQVLRERAQGIEARSDETPQAVQPEGREPGPKDAPKASGETPNQQAGRG